MRKKIQPAGFTPTMGAYSHGYEVAAGDTKLIFTTGQIALDDNGSLVSEDIEIQTRFVFERISTILGHAGATLDDVVKVQIFVTNIADFPKISPIRNTFLKTSEPVSTLVEVSALVHPGCKIEIEAVAAIPV